MVSLNDMAIRPPRVLADGEIIDLGGKRVRYVDTPHVPHGWDAGVLFEETNRTWLCGDLFSHIRMVYRKAKPQGTLLKEFKEHVVPARQPRSFVDEVLLPMAQAFAELRDAAVHPVSRSTSASRAETWPTTLNFSRA